MLLICPTCRSGLQVPDGTTAHVRCPSCQLVFAASQGVSPPPPPEAPRVAKVLTETPRVAKVVPSEPVARRTARIIRDDEDEEISRTPKRGSRDYNRRLESKKQKEEDRESLEEKRRIRRRKLEEGLSAQEKKTLAEQYTRGSWGSQLIYIGLVLQAFALLIYVIFLVRFTVTAEATASLIVIAGILGLINWVLGPVGLGLVLSSRPVPGLYQSGIAAAIVMLIHGVFLFIMLASSVLGRKVMGMSVGIGAWGVMPTKLDSLTFYLTLLAYPDLAPGEAVVFPLCTGLAEMIRLVLIMITLSYVASGAGDGELRYRCVRAAGIASLGPVALAVGMLLTVCTLIETGAIDLQLGKIILLVAIMGVYAILAGMLVPSLVAARETSEACEFPYQSQNFEIGDKMG